MRMPSAILLRIILGGKRMYYDIPLNWYWKKDFFSGRSPDKLEQEIKESDFLVADEKCVHRIVGLKYDRETMLAPKTTCICARFEMPLAKSIAFYLEKPIFYDDKCSASLFNKARGEYIDESDFIQCSKFYSDYYREYKPLIFNLLLNS